MSSDQQLNVHISIASDLRQNKPNDKQCEFECSLDNTIASSLVSQNETASEIKPYQCASRSENGQSLSENGQLTGIENNVNLSPSEEIMPFAVKNVNNLEVIKQFDEKIISQDDGDPVYCHNNGVQEAKGIFTNDFNNRDDNFSPTLNNEAITLSVSEDPSIVDSQIPTPPHIINLNQSNEQAAEQPRNSTSDKESEDIQPRIQKENSSATNSNENKDPQHVATETTNEIAESATVNASTVDDNEIGEAPNDENEIYSNEYNSNEDSCEIPDTEDFDGANEVENDEYILDTVVRKPRKQRRRIVSVNDDSDPEIEVERERLLQSPTIEENRLTDSEAPEDTIDIELLIQNEKPGPKSKKMSTQKLKELQTRQLLRNVVVIPSSNKKKKRRIIDSDEDEENSLPYCVNVDDIGLPDTVEENDNNETDVLVDSILINDLDKPESSSFENSDQCSAEPTPSDVINSSETTFKSEPDDENAPIMSQYSGSIECPGESLREIQEQPQGIVPKLESLDKIKSETALMCDSGDTDSSNKQVKQENEDHVATTDFPPFPPSSSSSENEDEFIPNDVYFGTPDTGRKGYVTPTLTSTELLSLILELLL